MRRCRAAEGKYKCLAAARSPAIIRQPESPLGILGTVQGPARASAYPLRSVRCSDSIAAAADRPRRSWNVGGLTDCRPSIVPARGSRACAARNQWTVHSAVDGSRPAKTSYIACAGLAGDSPLPMRRPGDLRELGRLVSTNRAPAIGARIAEELGIGKSAGTD